MSGRVLGAMTAAAASEFITIPYTANSVTQKVFTAVYPCVITDIRGTVRVQGSGGACTFDFYKDSDGVAVASGTKLNVNSYDLAGGTVDTNQSLTLVNNQDSLTLKAGDAIGIALTGTPTSAVGFVQITAEPLNA